jgi:hypothetical protein
MTTRPCHLSSRAIDWPGYWFARLEESLNAGDFETAADAAHNLRRLGVRVTYPRPLLGPAQPCPDQGEAKTCEN